ASYTPSELGKLPEGGDWGSELFVVIGAHAFADIASWKDYPSILDRSHFAVVSRPRFHVGDLPARLPDLKARMVMPPLDDFAQMDPVTLLIDALTADVSSTAIRDRVGA